MKLYTEYRMLLKREIGRDYIYAVFLIITNYIAITTCSIVIDNIYHTLNMDAILGADHLMGSLQAILLLAGCALIGKQYHDIMRLNTMERNLMQAMGESKKVIRKVSVVRFLLFPVTIVIGAFMGYYSTHLLVNTLSGFVMNALFLKVIDSIKTFLIITTGICLVILSIGIYHDRKIKKNPAPTILFGFTSSR